MSRVIGNHFEQKACQLITEAGFEIVATNYTVPKVGEIDIIAYGDETLVVVEVKAKSRSAFGMAIDRVTPAKQKKISNALLYFLQDERYCHYAHAYIRFDVIGFDDGQVNWIENAFLV